ncbi:MAG: hypothetical protein RL708_659 [Bacteroidota bacterium]|jgi:hypothetical protein
MKWLFLSCLFCLNFCSKACPCRLNLYEKILLSDEIVFGTISNILNDTIFELNVSRNILKKESNSFSKIKINKNQNFEYRERRYCDYMLGQKGIFFLKKVKDNYEIISDGEIISQNDSVFYSGDFIDNNKMTRTNVSMIFCNHQSSYYCFSLNDFTESILIFYNKCDMIFKQIEAQHHHYYYVDDFIKRLPKGHLALDYIISGINYWPNEKIKDYIK